MTNPTKPYSHGPLPVSPSFDLVDFCGCLALKSVIRQVALVFQLECLAVVLTCMLSAFTATATPGSTVEHGWGNLC